jgi:hypothetical protein
MTEADHAGGSPVAVVVVVTSQSLELRNTRALPKRFDGA